MKLPEIYGKNKIRDFRILQMFMEGYTETDIGISMEISQTRVSQIVYRNRSMLNADKSLEKAKRINHLKRLIKNSSGESKKDVADLIDQLRNELEGSKVEHFGKIGGGTTVNVFPNKTIVFTGIDDLNENTTPIQDVYATESENGSRLGENASSS